MRLKLDENLGAAAAERFRRAGHDASTVHEQHASGSTDRALLDLCRSEGRARVTLDAEFAHPLRISPAAYSGIVVLRLPSRITPAHLVEAIDTLVSGLSRASLDGKLWIVQRGRIREYSPDPEGG